MKPFWTQLRFVLPYLAPHRWVLVGSLLLSLLSAALGMVQPYFAKIIIDRVFLERAAGLLAPLLAAMIVLMVLGFGVRVTNSYLYTRYSARFLFRLREDLFDHLHRIPLRFFTRKKIGDIYSRVAADMAEVQGVVTDTLPQYLFHFITVLVTVGIMVWLDGKMTLLSLLVLPVALLVIGAVRPRILALSREVTETNADMAHFLFESLGNTSLVRAYGAEGAEGEKLAGLQGRLLGFLLRYQVLGACSGAVPILFILVNTLIVFGYGGVRVVEGTLTVGTLVAFSIYQGRMLGPLQAMMDGYLAIQKTKIALARVREILDIPKAARSPGTRTVAPEDFRGEISFRNVSFAYEEAQPVLENLSFDIPAGRVTALVGPSGSGKTTVCHLILGLFRPDAGRITLDGIDLGELRMDWFRRQIALVSQDTLLFHTSVLENIRFSCPGATTEDVVAAARAACIDDFVRALPDGYDTQIGDRGLRLSGGQKQRISIARAVLLDPRILILDEATAFLDTAVEERLKRTLRELMGGRVVLVVSHRMSTIRDADRIVRLPPPRGQGPALAVETA